MNIHERIRALRKEKGLTQEQLAEIMGVSVAAVSKWETGQTLPELAALAGLADFFQVSIDSLVGHTVRSRRLDNLLHQMKAQEDQGQFREALDTAGEVLRYFPNQYEAVDACASLYYNQSIRTGDWDFMNKAVPLVEQLFLFTDDPSELKQQALLARLANMYELLDDWDNALEKYEKSNLNGINDRHIAQCLYYQGKTQEALAKISDVILASVQNIFNQAMLLADIWADQEEWDHVLSALNLGISALAPLSGAPGSSVNYALTVMLAWTACLLEDKGSHSEAESAAVRAVDYAISCDGKDDSSLPFLRPSQNTEKRVSNHTAREVVLMCFHPEKYSRLRALAASLEE